ncbi:hypothetical protein [Coleofasciculus sp. FACHB-SPT9]|uniref:hypothetical protein n=1 Tax=Cyanophyceae TaxID=3028117 RepID=UPI0016843975|nr:hypothetical protein [Coleofasciculus sp. FACHB-SPT9]MBD1892928.1 hypothetical protein [Coleofasciculus sp. FACHB-SPT9]
MLTPVGLQHTFKGEVCLSTLSAGLISRQLSLKYIRRNSHKLCATKSTDNLLDSNSDDGTADGSDRGLLGVGDHVPIKSADNLLDSDDGVKIL